MATTKTTAATTAATAAGTPRIMAPTAAIAMPMPIRTSLMTEKPFCSMSTKDVTASAAPAKTAPMPPMDFKRGRIVVIPDANVFPSPAMS